MGEDTLAITEGRRYVVRNGPLGSKEGRRESCDGLTSGAGYKLGGSGEAEPLQDALQNNMERRLVQDDQRTVLGGRRY